MKAKPAERTGGVQEYYFSRKLAQIEKMRKEGRDVINLGIGSPDQSPSENTIGVLAAEAHKKNTHGYQSYRGAAALRKGFADWYSEYFKVKLDPDTEILPLIGSKEGIMHISMAYIDPGDVVLVPDPGYPTYSSVTTLTGGIVRNYDLNEEGHWLPDLEILEDSDLSAVKLMWINYPHMPSGANANYKMFERIVAFADRHSILLCNDNPYSFILNDSYLSILAVDGAMDTALELNSLSKSHNMAGWRVGMVAGNSDNINNILKVKSNMDSGMFLPLQLAAAEALNNPKSWYDDVNAVYFRRRKTVVEIMDILQCRYDPEQTGLFVWGKLPDAVSDCESFVEDILTSVNVFITPGFIFGKNGSRYIRISLCASEERLAEALERIRDHLENRNLSPSPYHPLSPSSSY